MTILNMVYSSGGSASNYTISWSTVKANYSPSDWSNIQGCFISADGTKMYIDYWSNKRLYQYSLSTPRDISTATSVRYIALTSPDGFSFWDNGKYLFVWNESDHTIKRYTLSTDWDISTATLDQSLSLNTFFPTEVNISENWEHIYYTRFNWAKFVFYSYDLSTPYDLTTAINQKTYDDTNLDNCIWIFVNNKWENLYVCNENTTIIQYTLGTPYDITSTKTEIWRYTLTWNNDWRCLCVSPDLKYWTFGIWTNWVSIRQFEAVKI